MIVRRGRLDSGVLRSRRGAIAGIAVVATATAATDSIFLINMISGQRRGAGRRLAARSTTSTRRRAVVVVAAIAMAVTTDSIFFVNMISGQHSVPGKRPVAGATTAATGGRSRSRLYGRVGNGRG